MHTHAHAHTYRVSGTHGDTTWKQGLPGLESQSWPMYHSPRRQPSMEKKNLRVPNKEDNKFRLAKEALSLNTSKAQPLRVGTNYLKGHPGDTEQRAWSSWVS